MHTTNGVLSRQLMNMRTHELLLYLLTDLATHH